MGSKTLILSKLEEGCSIRRVAQYYNITKSTVQRIKQIILWCSKISATFYVVKQTYLTYIKKRRLNFKKASLHVEKTVINRLLGFSGVLYNFEINCTFFFIFIRNQIL
jgi:hypothetical protein